MEPAIVPLGLRQMYRTAVSYADVGVYLHPAYVVGAVVPFENAMSVLAVNVNPLVGDPCVNVGDAAVPTDNWLGRVSMISTVLESTADGPELLAVSV